VLRCALARLLRELGMNDAVNFDGGGSSALVFRDPGDGEVRWSTTRRAHPPERSTGSVWLVSDGWR
jgi:hypothetical protein